MWESCYVTRCVFENHVFCHTFDRPVLAGFRRLYSTVVVRLGLPDITPVRTLTLRYKSVVAGLFGLLLRYPRSLSDEDRSLDVSHNSSKTKRPPPVARRSAKWLQRNLHLELEHRRTYRYLPSPPNHPKSCNQSPMPSYTDSQSELSNR